MPEISQKQLVGARRTLSGLKMNLGGKIFWRLKFLILESWKKAPEVIILSLFSAGKRSADGLFEFLDRKKIISCNLKDNFFRYKNYSFHYGKNRAIGDTIADFISIWGQDSVYLKNNFLDNSAYNFEPPYEDGRVKIANSDYVIDAGANIGLFSLMAGEKVGVGGKVFAFEPIKITHEVLLKNISGNLAKNVKVYDFALGESEKDLKFSLPDSLGDSSGFFKGDYPEENVKQSTIDRLVQKGEIEKVDFIKADIEGMERDMIKGAKETIMKFKPKLSVRVYHRPDDPRVIKDLIKSFVPEYNIKITLDNLYAWV